MRAGHLSGYPFADDVAILRTISEQTCTGTVDLRDPKPSQWDRKPQARWIAQSKTDCLSIVGILDRYPLRAKKARDYAIWREAVLLWVAVGASGGPGTAHDWSRLATLKTQLEEVRVYR